MKGPVTALGFWRDEVDDEHRPRVAHAHWPGDHQEECSASIRQIIDNEQMGTKKNSRVHAEMFSSGRHECYTINAQASALPVCHRFNHDYSVRSSKK